MQVPHTPLGDAADAAGTATPPPAGSPEVFLAALPPEADGTAACHYNGKLERPAVHRPPPSNATLAAWDFAIGISTQSATDTGPHAAHAGLINLPTRAMTGSNWTGAVHDWKAAPDQYGAIHFHDDDQGPLGWDESVRLEVPANWPSGFYAAHVSNEAGEDYIPFIVRPRQPQADVALVVPTFSYQVYGCFVRPGRGVEIAERASAWGALCETPDRNPQFGLSCYNHHSDGSGVSLVTQFRPMLDTRPRQFALVDPAEGGSGTARWVADNYIDQFLSTIGIAHDVITDHDLHAEGVAALAPYRVVIAAQHPEYHSERMMSGWSACGEDMLTHRHPLAQQDWSCADMTFFETAAGGAVFSVGSMTYAGSLMIENGNSPLGRLTANVVRRFIDPTPFMLPKSLTASQSVT